jgi:hypothetical protein
MIFFIHRFPTIVIIVVVVVVVIPKPKQLPPPQETPDALEFPSRPLSPEDKSLQDKK